MRLEYYLFFFIVVLLSSKLCSQENSFLLCADGIDNDGDGLVDCEDEECYNLPNNGCATCIEGTSFADVSIEYVSGCPAVDPDPEGALGLSDWSGSTSNNPEFVSLGEGGFIKLGFTNNQLTNSGDNLQDLWVFEIGPAVEPCAIALLPADPFTLAQVQLVLSDLDGDGYYEFGTVEGGISGLDIDAIMPGYDSAILKFNAVEVKDIDDGPCSSDTAGADIDAVCALTSLPLDCAGVRNGPAVFDACGECLEIEDPEFNQSCADCAGIPNGLAIIDACGECLDPDDPAFNLSCMDCAGVPNGTSELDDCDECLPLNDPLINQTCVDCLGILFGTAIIDECGQCLEPNDLAFNQSCADCAGIPNGLAIIDECGECLEPTDSTFNQSCIDCAGVLFGHSILDECGQCLQPAAPSFNKTCIEEIYVPNSFSPNRDGINDDFRIFKPQYTIAIIKSYRIFSRWGELVYEARDFGFNDEFHNWWNGQFTDDSVNTGVYVYDIKVQFNSGNIVRYAGDINIVQ